MVLVRDIFQLKFGQAREGVALWREGLELGRRVGHFKRPARLLTDLSGPYYTLVLESTYDDLADFEQAARSASGAEEWRQWYQRFVPVAECGRREIFTIVE